MTQIEPVTEPIEGEAPVDAAAYQAMQLENALLRGGVDLDSPQGQIVRDAWQNRTPDVEAIRNSWELVKPQAPAPEPTVVAEQERVIGEQNQASERRELNANSVVEPNPEDVDPRKAAVAAGYGVLAPTDGSPSGTRDDALASGIHVLMTAASNGDARVLVDESRSA